MSTCALAALPLFASSPMSATPEGNVRGHVLPLAVSYEPALARMVLMHALPVAVATALPMVLYGSGDVPALESSPFTASTKTWATRQPPSLASPPDASGASAALAASVASAASAALEASAAPPPSPVPESLPESVAEAGPALVDASGEASCWPLASLSPASLPGPTPA